MADELEQAEETRRESSQKRAERNIEGAMGRVESESGKIGVVYLY